MTTSVGPSLVRDVTDEEVAAYVRDGWVSLPGFVDKDLVAEMLAASKSLMGESGADWELRPGVDIDFDLWHDRHFLAREGIEPFRSLAYAPRIGQAAQRFNQRDVAIRHYQDMIAVKPPAGTTSRSKATPFHQDFPNRQFDRVGNVSIWIALEEMPAERGTMRFCSGSHREGSLGHNVGRSPDDPDVHEVYPWLAERCPLSEPRDMGPGDATAHSSLVLHCAPENTTDVPRWVYISMYIPADTLWTGQPFSDADVQDVLVKGQPFDHPNYPIIYP